jgi:hypothetical protein
VYCIEQETKSDFVSITVPFVNSLPKRPRQWIAQLLRRGDQRGLDGRALFSVVHVAEDFCLVTRSPPTQALFPRGVTVMQPDGEVVTLSDDAARTLPAPSGPTSLAPRSDGGMYQTGARLIREHGDQFHAIALPLRLDLFSIRDLRAPDAALVRRMASEGRLALARLLDCAPDAIAVYVLIAGLHCCLCSCLVSPCRGANVLCCQLCKLSAFALALSSPLRSSLVTDAGQHGTRRGLWYHS